MNDIPQADRKDGGPAIHFASVSKSFGSSAVLNNISFPVAAGAAFVILGRSGTARASSSNSFAGF